MVSISPTQEAIEYIVHWCSHIGSFNSTQATPGGYSNVPLLLANTASEIETSKPTLLFPDRYKEHVAYSLRMISNNAFLSPPSSVASVYLITRLEFYFRLLSEVLNPDGTWISSSAGDVAAQKLNDPTLKNKSRINSVASAYKIMKLNQSKQVTAIFDQLDKTIFAPSSSEINDIGSRVEWVRHRTAHGEWGDISAESIFYGLLIVILFYNQA